MLAMISLIQTIHGTSFFGQLVTELGYGAHTGMPKMQKDYDDENSDKISNKIDTVKAL